MNEVLVMDNLEFEVRRSARRKTFGLTVDRAGELVVHVPETAEEDEVQDWLKPKLLWVHRKLLTKESYAAQTRTLDVVSGETIAYLGKNYRLRIVKKQLVPMRFDGQWFLLREQNRLDAPRIFQKWYQDKGTLWLNTRIRSWESRVGKSPTKVVVSDLGFRWGSCSKTGIIRFNWRLLQLPVRLVDYVMVHELTHLHERNHTPEFWQILDRVLPDWKERKEGLRGERAEMNWCKI